METSLVRAQVWASVVRKLGMLDKLRFWYDVWCAPVSLVSVFQVFIYSLFRKCILFYKLGLGCRGYGFDILPSVEICLSGNKGMFRICFNSCIGSIIPCGSGNDSIS